MNYALYRGVVTNSGDPEQGGRVQIIVPAIASSSGAWARTALPPGSQAGYRTGQSVWVMFEGGNSNYPVVIGVCNDG